MRAYSVQTLTGVVLDRQARFTLEEFCRLCGTERAQVLRMIDEGIVDPDGQEANWRFRGDAVVRARRALRLIDDLGVNLQGAALALDLLDELDEALKRASRSVRDEPAAARSAVAAPGIRHPREH